MEPVVFIIVIILVIIGAIFGFIAAQKRREAMLSLASRLGLHFDQSKDKSIGRQYDFLDKLRQGHNRYAYNILSGNYQGCEVKIFDYHYQTGSGKLASSLDGLTYDLNKFGPEALPSSFDMLCGRVERVEGVRFRELWEKLPKRSRDGDKLLKELIEAARGVKQ